MLINLRNTLTNQEGIQQTYLGGTIGPGATSAGVVNISGFKDQWAVQIGQTGEETAEIQLVSGSPSGTTINFGTAPSNTGGTVFNNHPNDAPVYNIHYDRIILYRSTAGTGGTFSALGTYNIQPDNSYTQIEDTTGASGYAYYAQYYNSLSGDTSGSSSVFVPGGPSFYSLQAIRQRIKDKLYSTGYIRADSVIDNWINACYEDMTNSAIKVNENYLMGSQTVTFGTDGLGTITDDTYKQMIKLEVAYGNNHWIPSYEKPFADFSEDDYFSLYNPRHAWRGENVFEILPHQQGGTTRCYYATRFTPMTQDSDTLTQTLKAYTEAFVEYGVAQAYGLDQKPDFDKHMAIYTQKKGDFIAEVTPRDVSSEQMINMTSNPSAMDEDLQNEIGEYWGIILALGLLPFLSQLHVIGNIIR